MDPRFNNSSGGVQPPGPPEVSPGVSMLLLCRIFLNDNRRLFQKYQFSADELRVLRECEVESFYQRSLPIGTGLSLAAWYCVKQGYVKVGQRRRAPSRQPFSLSLSQLQIPGLRQIWSDSEGSTGCNPRILYRQVQLPEQVRREDYAIAEFAIGRNVAKATQGWIYRRV